jgi:hypothetical protein
MTQPTPPEPTPTLGDPAPTPPAPTPTPPAPPAPGPDDPLGPAGLKALQAERDRVKALETQLAALAPLQKLAEAFGATAEPGSGKSDVDALRERFDAQERDLIAERTARWRAEIAAETGLSAQLAARLQGTTRDELLADAQALAALIPAAPPEQRGPAPDPSQGARGTGPADLDQQIAAAEQAGDIRKAIALKTQKLTAKK